MPLAVDPTISPRTQAVRRALNGVNDAIAASDFLFLEAWELQGSCHPAAILRAKQIRRANPHLAAEIEAELRRRS
jgi:hypothetical protein